MSDILSLGENYMVASAPGMKGFMEKHNITIYDTEKIQHRIRIIDGAEYLEIVELEKSPAKNSIFDIWYFNHIQRKVRKLDVMAASKLLTKSKLRKAQRMALLMDKGMSKAESEAALCWAWRALDYESATK